MLGPVQQVAKVYRAGIFCGTPNLPTLRGLLPSPRPFVFWAVPTARAFLAGAP